MEVCFTCNNTSSVVNPFNAEPLPTAYATVPENHAYALSEYSNARCAWKKLEHLRYLRCQLTRVGGISLDR